MPVITLLTDFGLRDEYVGVMKGVILSINPQARVVDITHDVARHSILQGALTIEAAYAYFPSRTIHVVVVDPGVGGSRKILCLETHGHLFLAPDNGLLGLVARGACIDGLHRVTNDAYFLKPLSHTFHGRDIFAPVAAHLSIGLEPHRLGPALPVSDIKALDLPRPWITSAGELRGEVLSIDRFGNLITNIDRQALERFREKRDPQELHITIGDLSIKGIAKSYDAVGEGAPVAIVGSRNLLEVSVNQGDARAYFRAEQGEAVRVSV